MALSRDTSSDAIISNISVCHSTQQAEDFPTTSDKVNPRGEPFLRNGYNSGALLN